MLAATDHGNKLEFWATLIYQHNMARLCSAEYAESVSTYIHRKDSEKYIYFFLELFTCTLCTLTYRLFIDVAQPFTH